MSENKDEAQAFEIEVKAGNRFGRRLRGLIARTGINKPSVAGAGGLVEPYDPNAYDGDGDGKIQDNTRWERTALSSGHLPVVPDARTPQEVTPQEPTPEVVSDTEQTASTPDEVAPEATGEIVDTPTPPTTTAIEPTPTVRETDRRKMAFWRDATIDELVDAAVPTTETEWLEALLDQMVGTPDQYPDAKTYQDVRYLYEQIIQEQFRESREKYDTLKTLYDEKYGTGALDRDFSGDPVRYSERLRDLFGANSLWNLTISHAVQGAVATQQQWLRAVMADPNTPSHIRSKLQAIINNNPALGVDVSTGLPGAGLVSFVELYNDNRMAVPITLFERLIGRAVYPTPPAGAPSFTGQRGQGISPVDAPVLSPNANPQDIQDLEWLLDSLFSFIHENTKSAFRREARKYPPGSIQNAALMSAADSLKRGEFRADVPNTLSTEQIRARLRFAFQEAQTRQNADGILFPSLTLPFPDNARRQVSLPSFDQDDVVHVKAVLRRALQNNPEFLAAVRKYGLPAITKSSRVFSALPIERPEKAFLTKEFATSKKREKFDKYKEKLGKLFSRFMRNPVDMKDLELKLNMPFSYFGGDGGIGGWHSGERGTLMLEGLWLDTATILDSKAHKRIIRITDNKSNDVGGESAVLVHEWGHYVDDVMKANLSYLADKVIEIRVARGEDRATVTDEINEILFHAAANFHGSPDWRPSGNMNDLSDFKDRNKGIIDYAALFVSGIDVARIRALRKIGTNRLIKDYDSMSDDEIVSEFEDLADLRMLIHGTGARPALFGERSDLERQGPSQNTTKEQAVRDIISRAKLSDEPVVNTAYGNTKSVERFAEIVALTLVEMAQKMPMNVNDAAVRMIGRIFGLPVQPSKVKELKRRKRISKNQYSDELEDISDVIMSTVEVVSPEVARRTDGHTPQNDRTAKSRSDAMRFDPDERSRITPVRSNIGLDTDQRLYAFDQPVSVTDYASRPRLYSIGDHHFYDTETPFGTAIGFRRRMTRGRLAAARYTNRARPHNGDMIRAISATQFGIFVDDMPVYDTTTVSNLNTLRGLVSGAIRELSPSERQAVEQAVLDATHIHSAIQGAYPQTKRPLFRTVNINANIFAESVEVGDRIPMPITAFSHERAGEGGYVVLEIMPGAKAIDGGDGQFLTQGTFEIVELKDDGTQLTAVLRHAETFDPRHDAMRPVDRFSDSPGAMRKMGRPMPRYTQQEQRLMEADRLARRDELITNDRISRSESSTPEPAWSDLLDPRRDPSRVLRTSSPMPIGNYVDQLWLERAIRMRREDRRDGITIREVDPAARTKILRQETGQADGTRRVEYFFLDELSQVVGEATEADWNKTPWLRQRMDVVDGLSVVRNIFLDANGVLRYELKIEGEDGEMRGPYPPAAWWTYVRILNTSYRAVHTEGWGFSETNHLHDGPRSISQEDLDRFLNGTDSQPAFVPLEPQTYSEDGENQIVVDGDETLEPITEEELNQVIGDALPETADDEETGLQKRERIRRIGQRILSFVTSVVDRRLQKANRVMDSLYGTDEPWVDAGLAFRRIAARDVAEMRELGASVAEKLRRAVNGGEIYTFGTNPQKVTDPYILNEIQQSGTHIDMTLQGKLRLTKRDMEELAQRGRLMTVVYRNGQKRRYLISLGDLTPEEKEYLNDIYAFSEGIETAFLFDKEFEIDGRKFKVGNQRGIDQMFVWQAPRRRDDGTTGYVDSGTNLLVDIDIYGSVYEKPSEALRAAGYDISGQAIVGTFTRGVEIHSDGKFVIEHRTMFLNKEGGMAKNVGLGTVLNQHAFQFWQQLPGTVIHLSAAQDGPLVWPRHGFVPTEAINMRFVSGMLKLAVLFSLADDDRSKQRIQATVRRGAMPNWLPRRASTSDLWKRLLPPVSEGDHAKAFVERMAVWLTLAGEVTNEKQEARLITLLANLLDTSSMTRQQKSAWSELFGDISNYSRYSIEVDQLDQGDDDFLPSFVIKRGQRTDKPFEKASLIVDILDSGNTPSDSRRDIHIQELDPLTDEMAERAEEIARETGEDPVTIGRSMTQEQYGRLQVALGILGIDADVDDLAAESIIDGVVPIETLDSDLDIDLAEADAADVRPRSLRPIRRPSETPTDGSSITHKDALDVIREQNGFNSPPILVTEAQFSELVIGSDARQNFMTMLQAGPHNIGFAVIGDSDYAPQVFLTGGPDPEPSFILSGTNHPITKAGQLRDIGLRSGAEDPARVKHGVLFMLKPWARRIDRTRLRNSLSILVNNLRDDEGNTIDDPDQLARVILGKFAKRYQGEDPSLYFFDGSYYRSLDASVIQRLIQGDYTGLVRAPDSNDVPEADSVVVARLVNLLVDFQNKLNFARNAEFREEIKTVRDGLLRVLLRPDDPLSVRIIGSLLGYDVLTNRAIGLGRMGDVTDFELLNKHSAIFLDTPVSLADAARLVDKESFRLGAGSQYALAFPSEQMKRRLDDIQDILAVGAQRPDWWQGDSPSLLAGDSPIQINPRTARSISYQRMLRQDFGVDLRIARSQSWAPGNTASARGAYRQNFREGDFFEGVQNLPDLENRFDSLVGRLSILNDEYEQLMELENPTKEQEDRIDELYVELMRGRDEVAQIINKVNRVMERVVGLDGFKRAATKFINEFRGRLPDEQIAKVEKMLSDASAFPSEDSKEAWRLYKKIGRILSDDFDLRWSLENPDQEIPYVGYRAVSGTTLEEWRPRDLDILERYRWLDWLYHGFFDPKYREYRSTAHLGYLRAQDEPRRYDEALVKGLDETFDGINDEKRREWASLHDEYLREQDGSDYEDDIIDAFPEQPSDKPNGVPDQVWRKIRAALARGRSTPYEGERIAAHEAVKRLIEPHRPDLANDDFVRSARSVSSIGPMVMRGVNMARTSQSRGADPADLSRVPVTRRPIQQMMDKMAKRGHNLVIGDFMPYPKGSKTEPEIGRIPYILDKAGLRNRQLGETRVGHTSMGSILVELRDVAEGKLPPEHLSHPIDTDLTVEQAQFALDFIESITELAREHGLSVVPIEGHAGKKVLGPMDIELADALMDDVDMSMLRAMGSPTYDQLLDLAAFQYIEMARLHRAMGSDEPSKSGIASRTSVLKDRNAFVAALMAIAPLESGYRTMYDTKGNPVMSWKSTEDKSRLHSAYDVSGSATPNELLESINFPSVDEEIGSNEFKGNVSVAIAMLKEVGAETSWGSATGDVIDRMRARVKEVEDAVETIEFAGTPAGEHMRMLVKQRVDSMKYQLEMIEKIAARQVAVLRESGMSDDEIKAALTSIMEKGDQTWMPERVFGSATVSAGSILDTAIHGFTRMRFIRGVMPHISDGSIRDLEYSHEVGHFILGQGFTRHGEFVSNIWPYLLTGTNWTEFTIGQKPQRLFDEWTVLEALGKKFTAEELMAVDNVLSIRHRDLEDPGDRADVEALTKAIGRGPRDQQTNRPKSMFKPITQEDRDKIYRDITGRILSNPSLTDDEKEYIIKNIDALIKDGVFFAQPRKVGEEGFAWSSKPLRPPSQRSQFVRDLMTSIGMDPDGPIYHAANAMSSASVFNINENVYNKWIPIPPRLFGWQRGTRTQAETGARTSRSRSNGTSFTRVEENRDSGPGRYMDAAEQFGEKDWKSMGKATFSELIDGASRAELRALTSYLKNGAYIYNQILRMDAKKTAKSQDIPDDAIEDIDALLDLFERAPRTSRPVVLYRGLQDIPIEDYEKLLELGVGGEFSDNGIISTSANPNIAKVFSDRQSDEAVLPILEIIVPEGAKYIAGVTTEAPDERRAKALIGRANIEGEQVDIYHRWEDEVLLPPGTRFRIVRIVEPDELIEHDGVFAPLRGGMMGKPEPGDDMEIHPEARPKLVVEVIPDSSRTASSRSGTTSVNPQEVIDFVRAGGTLKQAAAKFGISPTTVGRYRKMGGEQALGQRPIGFAVSDVTEETGLIVRSDPPEILVAKFNALSNLISKGMGLREALREVGFSGVDIDKLISEMENLPPLPQKWTGTKGPSTDEGLYRLIALMSRLGFSVRKISDVIKRNAATIIKYQKHSGYVPPKIRGGKRAHRGNQ